MKRFLVALLLTNSALGATYNVALPGGGVLTVNGLPYVNPGITNSASVVWGVDGSGLLYATATGTNSSIVYVEGAAVAGPNFGLSTEIDPAVTASTNITFALVNSSITTNKIDSNFYTLLMQTGAGDVTQAGNNTFTGTNIFTSSTTISNLTVDALEANSLVLNTPIGVTAVGTNAADARNQLGVAYDVNVQAYHLELLQTALALTASGHMVYHNGTLVTNLTSTSPGRYLLTAATATDQRNALSVGELNQTVYSAAWDGVTNKTPTLDAIYDWGQALSGGSNAITTWNTNYFSVSGGYLDWVGGSVGGGSGTGDVVTTANNLLTGVNQFTNGLGQVFSAPPRVLGGRINGWTAPQMTPGTNAAAQAQFKVLGDGIPSIEFDGTTSEEISMVGMLGQDPDLGSFVTITFASDDTANTVCWQAQWQLLTLRGIDTNLLSSAATWTSNIPGTARVPTNITFSLNAPSDLVGGTNDFSKPYMLRITRLPGSDSSLSNAYLIGVDHRYGR